MRLILTPIIWFWILGFSLTSKADTGESVVADVHQLPPVEGSWNPFRYDAGYVLGTLAQVSARGVLIKTTEGQIKLGVNSTTGGYIDKICVERRLGKTQQKSDRTTQAHERQIAAKACTIPINPFSFSNFNTDMVAQLEQVDGRTVMAFFRSYFKMPIVESNNYLAKIFFVDPEILKPGAKYESKEMSFSKTIHYGAGSFDGRIVKATLQGVVRKAHELIIQVGNSGNIFEAISVSDEDLFKFALQAMSTGRYLQISYYQLYAPLASPFNLMFGYNTDLRAYGIEVLEDPGQEPPPATRP